MKCFHFFCLGVQHCVSTHRATDQHIMRTQNSCLFPLRVWILYLLLRCCRSDCELIGSSQPIVARVGDDVTLPCHLEPALDVDTMALEWTRPDLNYIFVYVWRSGQELVNDIHPSYRGRTSMFSDQLKKGNMSLKLSEVELSDRGTYRCFIPKLSKQALVTLIVAPNAVYSLVISLAGLDRDRGGVVLECRSGGWFPEPELLWLDAEGKLLSAGPTETVRGSDDLYTVSSRVTVDKRHSSRYTCRVQQTSINHKTEAHIHVPEVFFTIQATSSSMTLGFAISLPLCIVSFLTLFVWKLLNTIKSKRRQRSRRDEGGKGIWKTEDEKDGEDELDEESLIIITTELQSLEVEQLQEQTERQKNKSEKRENDLKQKLEDEKKEFEMKLHQEEEKIRMTQKELTSLRNKLEIKKKELVSIKANSPYWYSWSSTKETHQRSMKKAEAQVESLKTELQRKEEDLEAEIKQLKTTENELSTMMEKLNQTERHVDAPLAENKKLKDEKLENEAL